MADRTTVPGKEVVAVNGANLTVIKVDDQRVITLDMVDQAHGRPKGTARRNFNANKSRFVEGAECFVRNSSEAKELGFTAPNGLILLTERGYLMLVKSLTDDVAWDVQRTLVDVYFRARQQDQATDPLTANQTGGITKAVINKALADFEARQAVARAESEARLAAAFETRLVALEAKQEAALIEVATPMQRGLLALADRVQTLAAPSGRHKTSVDYRAAVDVLDDFGVPQKGRGGAVRSVSSQLDGFSRREGVAVRAEASTGKRLFHVDIIDRWLKEGGAQVIHKIIADLANRQAAGQRVIDFPLPKTPSKAS